MLLTPSRADTQLITDLVRDREAWLSRAALLGSVFEVKFNVRTHRRGMRTVRCPAAPTSIDGIQLSRW